MTILHVKGPFNLSANSFTVTYRHPAVLVYVNAQKPSSPRRMKLNFDEFKKLIANNRFHQTRNFLHDLLGLCHTICP